MHPMGEFRYSASDEAQTRHTPYFIDWDYTLIPTLAVLSQQMSTMLTPVAFLLMFLACAHGKEFPKKIANVDANDVSHFQRRKLKDFSDYIGLRVKSDKSLVAFGEKQTIQLSR